MTYQIFHTAPTKNNLARQEIDLARSCAKSLFSEITLRNSLTRIMKCLLSLVRFKDKVKQRARERREIIQVRHFFTLWDGVQGEEKQTTYQVLTKKII